MGLDIRWPIGVIFTIYGVMLILLGAITSPEVFRASLGVNIDVWWGTAMLVFGLFMGGLAYRASRQNRP